MASITDYRHCPETGLAPPLYVSDMVEISYGLRSYGVYFYVFIPLDFHRFIIKSLVQYLHTANLTASNIPYYSL